MLNSKKKIIIIILSTIAIIVSIVCISKKPIAYNTACKNFDSGDYIIAAKQFEDLAGYKDSNKKYNKSMVLSLKQQIDELIDNDYLSECKPIEYYTILEKCDRIFNNDFFSQLEPVYQEKLIKYYEYVQFLNCVFNFDSSHEFLEIDCKSNPYFSEKLTDFYDNYYKIFEKQTWLANDKYAYYDEKVTSEIEITTNVLLKLKDDRQAYSDSNVKEYLRIYISFEGSKYNIFSESCIVPITEINKIQVTTDESNLSQYYDTAQYKKEMGASNVAFVIDFSKKQPIIKYAPDYSESQCIRTLTLSKK